MSESTTKIQLKRKESTSGADLENVILDSGEPLYDATTGLLYIGAVGGNTAAGNTQAINEIKDLSDTTKLGFQIGNKENNSFEIEFENKSKTTDTGTTVAFKLGTLEFEKEVALDAGSLAVGSADKLTTARSIDGVRFDGSTNIHHYFKCTDASSAIKSCTAEISSGETTSVTFNLETGAHIYVKFTQTNTVENDAGLSLNVQSTGAKTIYYRGTKVTSGTFNTEHIYEFLYDGTYWQLITPLDLAWQTF